ncbi:MAG: hypothetical protein RLZZ501_938 [Pseudomonadota bacterium]
MSLGDDLSIAQSVAFALLHALEQEKATVWTEWAHGWLRGDDRSAATAAAAAEAAASPAGRHAARAAALFDQAQALGTEAAMLTAEGRNAGWSLDNTERHNTDCLIEAAEAIRLAGGEKASLRERARQAL